VPNYISTKVTAKRGVNFVRSVVEDGGSLFHKIEMENDLGIDALIELLRDGQPLNHQLAVQIKSGVSYYDATECECLIPVGSHRQYWLNHPLSVIGIVFVPSLKCAHWVDIKARLRESPTVSLIRFKASEANRFDGSTFTRLFVPIVLQHEVPDLSLKDAVRLFRSSKLDEMHLGLITMFRRYPNDREVWDEIVGAFRSMQQNTIPPIMIYYLAHIPWHPDIFSRGESIREETREYVQGLMASFDIGDIMKLLSFIDDENGISRGTVGQSVEAIVSSLPNANIHLEHIVRDSSAGQVTRDYAALILAMNVGRSAIPTIALLAAGGSWYAQELIAHLNSHGSVTPYS
jgi:hypothetical protein